MFPHYVRTLVVRLRRRILDARGTRLIERRLRRLIVILIAVPVGR
jgi:hypothetical protein